MRACSVIASQCVVPSCSFDDIDLVGVGAAGVAAV